MRKDNFIYIDHILDRAEKIIQFTEGMTEMHFIADEKTKSAVIRELEVIGEAAKRVSEDFKLQYPEIPWKFMTGMRDVLIHDYEDVDMFSVWDTVANNIPGLIILLKKITKP